MMQGIEAVVLLFAFGQDVCLSDLDHLVSCPEDTPITLWTMQQPGAIEQLEKTDA
jgi:hypothetical protein